MDLTPGKEYIGALLDTYAVGVRKMRVAAKRPGDNGVPPEMQAGPVNEQGWVEWRLLPSTLGEADIAEVEREFDVGFPPMFRAYLLARFHLFNQVHSRRYNQLIFMTDTPANRPLAPLRRLLTGWRPLIAAAYVPFAQWGDGWGPMCFDARERGANGDCPIVWLDHERVIPLGEEACRQREAMQPLAQPLYESCREFLLDVFGGQAAA